MNLTINKLISIDINKLSLEKIKNDYFDDYERYFNEKDESDLKINSTIRTGVSKKSNVALVIVEVFILEKPTRRFLNLKLDFYFSINKNNEDRKKLFNNITREAIPYASLEIVNVVKSLTSQDSKIKTINLPYDFLSESKSH